MPTIIVQGIPFNKKNKRHSLHDLRSDCKHDSCVGEERVVLEKLFSSYCQRGSVTCTYLWSLRTDYDYRNARYDPDNFAHLELDNADDISRICDAARNREIVLSRDGTDFTLTVTRVSSWSTRIDRLNDDCLNHIFSELQTDCHLRVANVCARWEKLAIPHMKVFKASGYLQRSWEKPLSEYGAYIKEISCSMYSSYFCTFIAAYCPNIERASICLEEKGKKLATSGRHYLSAMLAALRNLKSIRLYCELSLSQYAVMFKYYAWGTLEEIDINLRRTVDSDFHEPAEDAVPFDLSKFKKLKNLHITGGKIGQADIVGWEAVEDLTCLDLFIRHLHPRLAGKMEMIRKLKILHLPNSRIKDHFLIKILKNNQNIEELVLCSTTNLTDRSLQVISKLPNLKHLNISGMSNVSMESIHEMPSLKVLHCCGVQGITDQVVERIMPLFPNLTWFTAINCPVTVKCLKVAEQLVKNRPSGAKLRIEIHILGDSICSDDFSPLLDIHTHTH